MRNGEGDDDLCYLGWDWGVGLVENSLGKITPHYL